VRPVLFFIIGVFMLEMLKKHGIFLIAWLRIFMILRLVVLISATHSLESLILLLLYVKLAIALTMTVHLVPIVFLMKFRST